MLMLEQNLARSEQRAKSLDAIWGHRRRMIWLVYESDIFCTYTLACHPARSNSAMFFLPQGQPGPD